MKWFYDMNVAMKLLTGFVLVAVIAAVVGVVGIRNIKLIAQSDAKLYQNMTVPISELSDISTQFQRARVNVRDAILTDDPVVVEDFANRIIQRQADISRDLELYRETIESDDMKELYNDLVKKNNAFAQQINKVIDLTRQDMDEEAKALMSETGASGIASRELQDAIANVIKVQLGEAKKMAEINTSQANRTVVVMILIILAGALIAIGLGVFLSSIISKPMKILSQAADQLALGDVDVDINTKRKTKDEIGILMESFGKMVVNIKDQVHVTERIAAGNLGVSVNIKSEKDILNQSLKKVVDTLQGLLAEMDQMAKHQDAGDTDVFISDDKFDGDYRVMAAGVNDMAKSNLFTIQKILTCIGEFGKGNFNVAIEKFPGKKAIVNDNIEALRKNLKEVSSEVHKLIGASQDGQLSQRGNAKAFHGDWAELIKGLNGLLDAVIEPLQESQSVLEEMAKGNLKVSVKGDYKGDHAKIKHALNDTIGNLYSYVNEISKVLTEMADGNLNVEIVNDYRGDFAPIKNSLNNIIISLNEVLSNMNNASAQVALGARQVSDSAQGLSQGSTEQASAIEELTASMEEISSQTKLNATNANQANELALAAKEGAAKGNEQMKGMLKAMDDINEGSGNIFKIIKVIDEIAFQTNILALNAAVEAARAGQHGKGFAVVAEEVRNLAARSANAAKETTGLIEGSMKKVEGGTKIANDTALALSQIVEDVTKVTNLVGEIASASNEQALGINQVNQGILQVSDVVQTNSATSQESAAASEELSSQAELLRELVSRFKLKKGMGTGYRELDNLNPEVLRVLEDMSNKKKGAKNPYSSQGYAEVAATGSKPRISLSNNEFGKY